MHIEHFDVANNNFCFAVDQSIEYFIDRSISHNSCFLFQQFRGATRVSIGVSALCRCNLSCRKVVQPCRAVWISVSSSRIPLLWVALISRIEAHLLVLLMQDVSDATFHGSQLLVHIVQELVQVCSIELTALNQNLQVGKWSWSFQTGPCCLHAAQGNNHVSSSLHLGPCDWQQLQVSRSSSLQLLYFLDY